jgi:hypothetical protein
MNIRVEVDTGAAADMFDQLAQRAAGLGRVAEDAARGAQITDVPTDTGELAAGFEVRAVEGGAEIVNTARHARYVFGGTRYMPARPPTVRVDGFGDAVARELSG